MAGTTPAITVEVDAQGFIHIKGRVKRFAKVAGEMVSLEVVEKIACTAAPEHIHAAVPKLILSAVKTSCYSLQIRS